MATWKIDPSHSTVGFTVRHLMITKVPGRFTKFSGTAELPDNGFEGGRVEVSIDAASITTGEDKRDAHLRSPDFFESEKFPTLTFKSKRVEPKGSDKLTVVGDLTIRGVTKEVALDTEVLGRAKDPWGGDRVAFSAHTKINRKDYGLNWNQALEAGGVLVSENVEITLDVQFVKG